MENKKKEYIVPEVTVYSYESENGYVSSIVLYNTLELWENNYEQVEQYEDRNGWGAVSENNHFWE